MLLDKTELLYIDGKNDDEKLDFAAQLINKGGTVCFPTETVYGLGASALDEKAVGEIFKAKGRPSDNPLIIHLDDIANASLYCQTESATELCKLSEYFPGPLTVVLEKKPIIPDIVTAGLDTVGVRIPSHPVANRFLQKCKVPVAAPSANISGRPSPTCDKHVIEDMFGLVDAIICAGNSNVGLESTIVSLCKTPPILLRPGGITYEMLCEKLGKVDVSNAVLSEMKPGDTASAPGMKYKHYAPKTKVTLVTGETQKVIEFFKKAQNNENCAILAFEEDLRFLSDKNLFNIGAASDAESHARSIFAFLRATDSLPDLQNVYVHITGDKSGLNLAVFNRLLKASAYSILTL